MRRISIINQKGGVGKTTTSANLGAALAARGQRVFMIDLDPQAHLTIHLGTEPSPDRPSVYDVLTSGAAIDSAAVPARPNITLLPAYIDLAAAELELVSMVGRENILRDAVAAMPGEYDFLVIDCPPSLGLLTINALSATDEVLIPLQPHFLALQGLGKLFETVTLVRDRLNRNLRVGGVMLCLYEAGTRLATEVVDDLEQFLNASRGQNVPWSEARLFTTTIRRNIKLAECPSHGQTIFDYAPKSHGASDYARLARELLGEPLDEVEPAATAGTPVAAAGSGADNVEQSSGDSQTIGDDRQLAAAADVDPPIDVMQNGDPSADSDAASCDPATACISADAADDDATVISLPDAAAPAEPRQRYAQIA